MKEVIGSILRKKSVAIVEQTITSLFEQDSFRTMQVDDARQTHFTFIELIHSLVDALETGNPLDLMKKAHALFRSRMSRNIPVRFFLSAISQLRRAFSAEITQVGDTLSTPKEYRELLAIQQTIHQYLDQLNEIVVHTADPVETELAVTSQKFLTYEQSLFDIVGQELARIMMESEDIAVLIIDKNLQIIEANPALAKLVHVDRDRIIGGNIDDMFKPHEHQRFIQWVIEHSKSGNYVAEIAGKWTTISTRPIFLSGGLWGAIAIIRDMTSYKLLEDELNKREALASVGQLAAGMAHEIRNPLTSIKGFIQLLREQMGANQSHPYFSVILTEIERIDGLINDVLVLARYRDDQLVSEDFQLIEEVVGVIRLLEPELNRHGITINLKVDTSNTWVHGYRARIKQVFLNLIKNALEALVEKGTTIYVSVFRTINQVVVRVEDDGLGIPHQAKDHLFVPFFTTKSEGTGLGLSTSLRIVADHGGEIFADNSVHYGGACFEVRLPLLIGG